MRLFIGNLPYSATETELQEFFTEAGITVDSVNVMRDRFSGEARGFGFVEIQDPDMAQRAIQACNGKPLGGRALIVNEARPMERREGTAPGGGFRGGNRREGGGGSRNRY